MKILDKKINHQVLGFILIFFSLLLASGIITGSLILVLAGIKSGISYFAMIPLVCISVAFLTILVFGTYAGLRYFKNHGFKKNESLGKALIILSAVYFLFTLLSYVFSNVTGNIGGELRPIFALFMCLIIVPLGIALKNGVK